MMPKIKIYIIAFLLVAVFCLGCFMLGSAFMIRESQRWENNFKIANDSIIASIVNGQHVYQSGVTVMDKADFKEYFSAEWKLFAKDLNLKGISQVANINTVTTHNIKTTLKDSTINDTTKVRAFAFRNQFLDFKGYELADTLIGRYTHSMGLKIAISKQKRTGFANKILLRPFTRDLQATAIPSDTCTKITNLETYLIK